MQWILIAIIGAFAAGLILGKIFIPLLRALKAGQSIREIGPSWHNVKAGTPTIGGVIFIGASLLCVITGIGGLMSGVYEHLFVLLFSMVFGAIGFIDDFQKLRHRANEGLTAPQKFLLQIGRAHV